jgi:hypothetical protein
MVKLGSSGGRPHRPAHRGPKGPERTNCLQNGLLGQSAALAGANAAVTAWAEARYYEIAADSHAPAA